MPSHSYTMPLGFLLPFLCFSIFVIQLGLSLSPLPSTKLMQDIICKSKHNLPQTSALLPEEYCHDENVQRELNLVNIGLLVSATVGGALVAFPMGLLADRIGRVSILALSILGLFLSSTYSLIVLWRSKEMPITALWGTGAWLLIGGGRSVAEAMVFTMISDTVSERKRAMWFQWVVAAVIAAQILGPLLSQELIKTSVWASFWLSLSFILFGGILIAGFAPETLSTMPAKLLDDYYTAPSTRDTLRSLLRRPSIYLLPAATLTIPLASTQAELLMRLMPVQFSWSLSSSTLLLALSSLVTMVTLLCLLPGLSHLLQEKSILKRDICLLQGSTFFLVLGSLLCVMVTDAGFIVSGVVASSLASGIPTLARAVIVTTLPTKKHTGSFFGLLAVGEILGFLLFQFGMGALFDLGLCGWIGMPFGMGMVFALVISAALWSVKASKFVEENESMAFVDG